MLRVGGDQVQHLRQHAVVGHATAMQADVDLDAGAQFRAQPLRQLQVLVQPLRGVDQPLQLALRIERPLQVAVEPLRGLYRQRLAHQDVEPGKVQGVQVGERLVERHQPLGAGAPGDVFDQLCRWQGLGDDAVVLAGSAQGAGDTIDVAVQPVQVDDHHRPHRPVAGQFAVERAEIGVVRLAAVARSLPPHRRGGQGSCTDQEMATLHDCTPRLQATERTFNTSNEPPMVTAAVARYSAG